MSSGSSSGETNSGRQREHQWRQRRFRACFGGYKQSGNGREWGEAGFEEFLELKAVFGYAAPAK
jgi:acyl-CoA reductase-like NAD-dependent aldehyde dehydrogenase